MTIELFTLDRITENPWNERPLDDANIAQIAASLQTDGLLQNPVGRVHPTDPGKIQLAYGHHRAAAYRQLAAAHPEDPRWQLLPVDVRAIDDLAMARQAIVENHSRKDPSAIEKARAMLRLVTELGQTQSQAGEVFGLQQSNVSHLLRLLKLPADVQALVDAGELAEVAARYLVPLAEWKPEIVSKIAKGAQKVEPDERTEWVKQEIREALRDKAKNLSDYYTPWPLEWPAKPLPAPAGLKGTKDVPDELPPCKGCKFALARGQTAYCLREACYDAKAKLYPKAAVEVASKRLGIPAAAEGEKVTIVWDGGYSFEQQRQWAKAVTARRPELRLVPSPKMGRHNSELKDVTSSPFVALAATDATAVRAWLEGSKGKAAKAAPPKDETPLQKERRLNAEKELAEERAAERSLYNKAKADGLYLFDRAAQLVAENTVAAGGILAWAALHPNVLASQVSELNDARRELETAAKLGRGSDAFGARDPKPAPATPELDLVRRKYIAYTELVKEVAGYAAPAKLFGEFDKLVQGLAKHAMRAFAVELPAGWNSVPVHHTPANCWECGAFAGNPKGFTKAELKEGWGGDAKTGYHCPLHAPSKRLINVLAQAGEVFTAAADDVRGHAEPRPLRPAPKPSERGARKRSQTQPAPAKPVGVSTGRPSRAAQQRAQAAKPAGKGAKK